MTAWFRLMLRQRVAVLVVLAIITVISAGITSQAVLSSSLQQMFFGESAEYDAYISKVQDFGSDEFVLVGYADPAPLSVASLDRLQAAVDELEAMPEVQATQSLLSTPTVRGEAGTLLVETWADRARAQPDEAAALARLAAADPVAGGLVIDRSGGVGGAVVIQLQVDPDRKGEDIPGVRDRFRGAFTQAGFADEDLALAGLPVIVAGLIDESKKNLLVLFPVTGTLLGVIVLLLFRRLAPALVALGVSLVAVIWTMGFATLLDHRLNLFLAVVPAMVVIVAFSDIIHLWSAWLTERELGKDGDDAIVAAADDVGRACLLTSATTFVGFVSLSLIPTPVFRQLGVVLGFGVSVALLLAVTVVPILQSYLPPPPPRPDLKGALPRLVAGIVSGSERLATQRPRLVVGGFGVALVAACVGLTQLHVDAEFIERFSPHSQIRQESVWLEQHFIGGEALDVFVSFDEPEALLDDATWRGLQAAHDGVAALPQVEHAVSVVSVLDDVHEALGGAGRPGSRAAVSQELLLFETAGGEGMDALMDFERKEARLQARLGALSLRELSAAARDAEARVTEALPQASVLSASMVTLLGGWLDEIVAGQRNGVVASSVIICVLMMLGLRSAKVGLWSMIPNLFPLVVLWGCMALVWHPVDSDTLIVAMMAIGIGVDDTVHFLMRYRVEADRCDTTAEALSRTFAFAGRAIVTTTVILGLGFLPLAGSSYVPLRFVGVLLPGSLVLALLADLLLVPALVQIGWMRFGRSPPAEA